MEYLNSCFFGGKMLSRTRKSFNYGVFVFALVFSVGGSLAFSAQRRPDSFIDSQYSISVVRYNGKKPVLDGNGKPVVDRKLMTEVEEGSTIRVHPLDLRPGQDGLGHSNVEAIMNDTVYKKARADLMSRYMRVGGTADGFLTPALRDVELQAARDRPMIGFLRSVDGQVTATLTDEEKQKARQRYEDRFEHTQLSKNIEELKRIVRKIPVDSVRRDALITDLRQAFALRPFESGRKNQGINAFFEELVGDRKKAARVKDSQYQDLRENLRAVMLGVLEDSPLDMWLIAQEEDVPRRTDSQEAWDKYFSKLGKQHTRALQGLEEINPDLTNALRDSVDRWVNSDERFKKKYAHLLYDEYYDPRYHYKSGSSPVVIAPGEKSLAEKSLSDGHHGLRQAYELAKKIKELDPEGLGSEAERDSFEINLKLSSNFLLPDRKSSWNHHLLEQCERRQMYISPETRDFVIKNLLDGEELKDLAVDPDLRRRLEDSVGVVDRARENLRRVEKDHKSTPDQKRLANEAVAEAESARMKVLEGVNGRLATHLNAAVQGTFQDSIAEIKHNPMRSFVGAFLPHLDFEVGKENRRYKARIGNEGLHDYAEFYVAEWLMNHGFKPRFNEQTVQLFPPTVSSQQDPQGYQAQMANYINSLVSMAEARDLMFDQHSEDFSRLIRSITRKDRVEDYFNDLDKKLENGELTPRAHKELRKTPEEKVQERIQEYQREKGTPGGLADGRVLDPAKKGVALINAALTESERERDAQMRRSGVFEAASQEAQEEMLKKRMSRLPSSCQSLGVTSFAEVLRAAGDAEQVAADCADINAKIGAALKHPLFAPGTCLNPLGLNNDEMKSVIKNAMIHGGGAPGVAAAADAGVSARPKSADAKGVGGQIVDGHYTPESLRSILGWLQRGPVTPR